MACSLSGLARRVVRHFPLSVLEVGVERSDLGARQVLRCDRFEN